MRQRMHLAKYDSLQGNCFIDGRQRAVLVPNSLPDLNTRIENEGDICLLKHLPMAYLSGKLKGSSANWHITQKAMFPLIAVLNRIRLPPG